MLQKIVKPELLAPAGNLECAIAAFESGADAVYAGLSRFNAREKSDNFSFSDMSKLSAYAKKHKKKIYLTLNTLIKERELEDVFNDLDRIAPLDIDAAIVQDIGIVRMIRDFFPEMSIHASTQMGIHNSMGIRAAEIMGISRVILERQITLHELEAIIKTSPLEIEVFIHGALCCSLSGNCLFSSWIGGWSGNRGKCKQPCRRRYHSKSGENGFFFSTQDLYTLDLLPRLKKMGISSLKIEGRLKKADYVSRSVIAYRMMLDAEPEKERETLGKAKIILAGSPGRKWSSGFYTEESMKNVVQYTSSGISGALSGEIKAVSGKGFTVAVSRELKTGDRIRIQSRSADEGPRITITTMDKNGKKIQKAQRGETVTITSDRKVPEKALVYKVGEHPMPLSADLADIEELVPVIAVNLFITLSTRGITIECTNFRNISRWEKALTFEKAQKGTITDKTVRQAFSATRSQRIQAGKIDVTITDNPFVPMSILKKIRREFWSWVELHLEDLFTRQNSIRTIDLFIQTHFSTQAAAESLQQDSFHDTYMIYPQYGHTPSHAKETVRSMSIFTYDKTCNEVFLPCFTPETSLEALEGKVETAYRKGIRRFRIRSLYQIILLKKYHDIFITAAYPLPVSNSFAVRELASRGIHYVQAWVELEQQGLENLIRFSPIPVEIYRFGRPHILATRASIHGEGDITDSHGVAFEVKKDSKGGLVFLYGKKPMKIPEIENTGNCFDLTQADFSETLTTDFNFSKEWM